jgi:hypothetical protein
VADGNLVIGPAVRRVRIIEEDGTTAELFYYDGVFHRDDGPAAVTYHADGSVRERYWRAGKLHRVDGPAWIDRDASGSTAYEAYYRDGKLHREDGPATILRRTGEPARETWYRDGEPVPAANSQDEASSASA